MNTSLSPGTEMTRVVDTGSPEGAAAREPNERSGRPREARRADLGSGDRDPGGRKPITANRISSDRIRICRRLLGRKPSS